MSSLVTFANKALRFVTGSSPSPTLPEYLFLAGTFFFPQVNVDLIVRINKARIIFTWRNDSFGNNGWHLPGSIVRPNETFESRIQALILNELPFLIGYSQESITYVGFTQVIARDKPSIRSHFISHVYLIDYSVSKHCIDSLPSSVIACPIIPDDLIEKHSRYKPIIRKCLNRDPIVPEQYY